jgi:hypothetical protein
MNYIALMSGSSSGATDTHYDNVVFMGAPVVTKTTTIISCSPSTVLVGSQTTCTATVAGSSSTGLVTFSSSSGTGTFMTSNQCALMSGSCSVSYSDTTAGDPTITASYGGDANNAPSAGTATITVAIFEGIANSVTINTFNIRSSGICIPFTLLFDQCFSIQQNFYIHNPISGQNIYWVQNVILVGHTYSGQVYASAQYNVFQIVNQPGGTRLFPDACRLKFLEFCLVTNNQFQKVNLPTTLSLTTTVVGNTLTFSTSLGTTFTYSNNALSGSTIASNEYDPAIQFRPEIVVVGETLFDQAVFNPTKETSGSIAAQVNVGGNWIAPATLSLILTICGSTGSSTCASTAETSRNLYWTLSGQFSTSPISLYRNVQGIAFIP